MNIVAYNLPHYYTDFEDRTHAENIATLSPHCREPLQWLAREGIAFKARVGWCPPLGPLPEALTASPHYDQHTWWQAAMIVEFEREADAVLFKLRWC